ncbi:hypothetical protein K503DRAFT_803864 [Rhizopogon vinicolor AM-OR11-026]|uniref:VWFA domain-containing protein n=1 Tax=Rhizopogon vinicolor AM-OR11-026 TaxID=1314800 RepID=A0A1B7MNB1_9AGAM|nr:hypothetical protein K503DRAFT_803864 [Rhizopogon vinicolor AM-OR11-026]
MNLLDDGRPDHIRLQLPMAIFPRYGEIPQAVIDASTANARTRVQIAVDVQTSDVIQDIRSPTYPISLMRHKSRAGRKSERRMSATWLSTTFPDQDFVLTVHGRGLDQPRCFAEVDFRHGDTMAMQLLFVPKFKMPRVPSQEYIFVIDRSGSMNSQTTFNIFSFGSKVDVLSPCGATIELLAQISNIQDMDANYGRTKIAKALQFAVVLHNRECPTAMFVLTDGNNSSENLDPFTVVSSAVKGCKPNAPLRVFTLGIGEHVSSAMCEHIAREGGGECLFAVQSEDIIYKFDWHGSGSPPTVNFSPSNRYHPLPPSIVQLEPPPPIQQVPHIITNIFPGVRFNVFAITTFRSVPSEVRLRAKVDGSAEVLKLVVPVATVIPFKDDRSSIPLLHTLAAREHIKHLVEDRATVAPLPKLIVPASDEEVLKAATI